MARREFDAGAQYGALEFTLKRFPELLPKDGEILLLHPRAHAALQYFAPQRTTCITPEQTDWERLRQRGYKCLKSMPPHSELPTRHFKLAVVFPGESRDEALHLLALGASALAAGGTLLASMSNDLGAARFEDRLEELLGTIESQSKNKCRVFWGATNSTQTELLNKWLSLGTPQIIPGTELQSVPGLFSWNKIDQGSKLLAELMPELKGRVADLGSGYGYLTMEALKRSNQIQEIDLFDSDYRAIETSKTNLRLISTNAKVSFHWQDIQSAQNFAGKFDAVIMNPPFHEYGTLRVELGKRFFSTAAQLLIPGGSLYAVVNRHLPYDETLWGIFPAIEQLADKYGYRVLKART